MEREHKLIMGKYSHSRAIDGGEGSKILCEFPFLLISIACEIQIVREGALLCHTHKLSLFPFEEYFFFFLARKDGVKNECNNNKWVNNINVMHIRCLRTYKYCIYGSITNFVLKSVFSYISREQEGGNIIVRGARE